MKFSSHSDYCENIIFLKSLAYKGLNAFLGIRKGEDERVNVSKVKEKHTSYSGSYICTACLLFNMHVTDIQFWNNRKSLEGLSVRSVFFNVFQSLIVLLYVLDNNTNTVIKISCFVGLCIEVWKIHKVNHLIILRWCYVGSSVILCFLKTFVVIHFCLMFFACVCPIQHFRHSKFCFNEPHTLEKNIIFMCRTL
jgi:hypothetical protein